MTAEEEQVVTWLMQLADSVREGNLVRDSVEVSRDAVLVSRDRLPAGFSIDPRTGMYDITLKMRLR